LREKEELGFKVVEFFLIMRVIGFMGMMKVGFKFDLSGSITIIAIN
jgi:hypothetical protein